MVHIVLTGILAIGLATGGAAAANATTQPTDPYRPVIPYDAAGILGNPTNIVSAAAPSQAVTIPDGSAIGTGVKNAPAIGSANQTWQFTVVGFLDASPGWTTSVGGAQVPVTVKVPVVRIYNQQNGTFRCLQSKVGSSDMVYPQQVVFKDGCGNNAKTNELWIVAGNRIYWDTSNGGNTKSSKVIPGGLLPDTIDPAAVALVSYPTVAATLPAFNFSNAAVLAGNTGSSLWAVPAIGTMTPSSKLWGIRDMNPNPSPAWGNQLNQPTQPTCSGYICQFSGI